MHKTVAETEEFLDRFLGSIGELEGVELVICPPATALAAAAERTRRSPVRIAAQNVHEADSGAFTGEIAIPMLRELGVAGAIVGHSERRPSSARPTRRWRARCPRCWAPASCPSSASARRRTSARPARPRPCSAPDRGRSRRCRRVPAGRRGDRVRAHLGDRHGRTATPEQAQEAIAFIRGLLAARDAGAAAASRIVYGGSVKPDNAGELFEQPDIDGGLVGGASLSVDDFVAICSAADADPAS